MSNMAGFELEISCSPEAPERTQEIIRYIKRCILNRHGEHDGDFREFPQNDSFLYIDSGTREDNKHHIYTRGEGVWNGPIFLVKEALTVKDIKIKYHCSEQGANFYREYNEEVRGVLEYPYYSKEHVLYTGEGILEDLLDNLMWETQAEAKERAATYLKATQLSLQDAVNNIDGVLYDQG